MWFDGACSGNPGPMGAGAIVRVGGKTYRISQRKGRGTNNEAEYMGLIAGLEEAAKRGARTIHVRGDSQLILRQLSGQYAVKAANLRPFYEQAKALLAQFDGVKLTWVRREENAEADAAARDAVA